MERLSLNNLNKRLVDIKSQENYFQSSKQMRQFYAMAVNLHSKIIQYLRLESLPPNIQQTSDIGYQEGIIKASNLQIGESTENEQDSSLQPTVFTEQKSLKLSNSLKHHYQKKQIIQIKNLQRDKFFKELMQNVKLIILYQNKVDQFFTSINNQKKMTQVYIDQNSMNQNELDLGDKENQASSFFFEMKDNIEKAIKQCKQIPKIQVFPQVGIMTRNSEISSNDKKSLLTEMLKMSDMIPDQHKLTASAGRYYKKPCSERNYSMKANKKLLKQINFQGYKIQSINSRKQKKVQRQNVQHCSKCTIF